jgi:CheY-like chemotaxis protein
MHIHRILLIDDDIDDQLFFTEVLEDIDPSIVCQVAGNGLEGLEVLQQGFIPDLIFLDLNMPAMNGFDFLKEFREEAAWANSSVVIFTTSSHQQDKARAKALGAKAFLTKPNTVQELRGALEDLIA